MLLDDMEYCTLTDAVDLHELNRGVPRFVVGDELLNGVGSETLLDGMNLLLGSVSHSVTPKL
jgi:hypothetical protein